MVLRKDPFKIHTLNHHFLLRSAVVKPPNELVQQLLVDAQYVVKLYSY